MKRSARRSMALFEMESSVDQRFSTESQSSVDLAVDLQEQLSYSTAASMDLESRMTMFSTMLQKTDQRVKSYQAHSFLMARTTSGLADSLAALMESLDNKHPRAKHIKKKVRTKPTEVVADVDNLVKSVDSDASSVASSEALGSRKNQKVRKDDKEDQEASGTTPDRGNEIVDDQDAPAKTTEASNVQTVAVTETPKGPDLVALPHLKHTSTSVLESAQEVEQDPKNEDNETKTFKAGTLNKLIDQFIDSQSGSDDACHSKLLEARHQLNQLYDILTTLTVQVNTTETALILYDKELQTKLKQLTEIEAWRDKELDKCRIKKEEAEKMYIVLTAELKEMHQIASPATAMNISGGTVSTQASKQESLSLIQEVIKDPKGLLQHS